MFEKIAAEYLVSAGFQGEKHIFKCIAQAASRFPAPIDWLIDLLGFHSEHRPSHSGKII